MSNATWAWFNFIRKIINTQQGLRFFPITLQDFQNKNRQNAVQFRILSNGTTTSIRISLQFIYATQTKCKPISIYLFTLIFYPASLHSMGLIHLCIVPGRKPQWIQLHIPSSKHAGNVLHKLFLVSFVKVPREERKVSYYKLKLRTRRWHRAAYYEAKYQLVSWITRKFPGPSRLVGRVRGWQWDTTGGHGEGGAAELWKERWEETNSRGSGHCNAVLAGFREVESCYFKRRKVAQFFPYICLVKGNINKQKVKRSY